MFGKKSKSGREGQNLEGRFAALQKDLTRVGGGIAELTDTARGLQILVNEKDPAQKRNAFVSRMMAEGGKITGAIGPGDKLVQGRFATALLGNPGDMVGLTIMNFSREFVELEREMVMLRARIEALKMKMATPEMSFVNDENPANLFLRFIGAERDWKGMAERASILCRHRCADLFAGASEEELRKGRFVASSLTEQSVQFLEESAEQMYPDPAEVHAYITERELDDKRMKILLAVPYKNPVSSGHKIH